MLAKKENLFLFNKNNKLQIGIIRKVVSIVIIVLATVKKAFFALRLGSTYYCVNFT